MHIIGKKTDIKRFDFVAADKIYRVVNLDSTSINPFTGNDGAVSKRLGFFLGIRI